MSLPRILRENRRHRQRGPDLTQWSLYAVSALLSLFGYFRRYRGGQKVKERLSEAEDRRYREWARGEAEGC